MAATNGVIDSASVQELERQGRAQADSMDGQIASIRELVEREERVREALRIHTSACEDRLRRLKRALNALVDEPVSQARPKPKEWNISPEKVEQIYRLFVEAGEPRTPSQLAGPVSGLSNESVAKALVVLRQDGRMRLVGKTRGGGRLYAVVPQMGAEGEGDG